MVKTAIVDDMDPNIVYNGGWEAVARTYSTTSNEFNSTFHYASSNGLTMRYSFKGTGITVYGTMSQPTTYGIPVSTYSIDDGTPYRFNSTGDVVSTGNPTYTFSHIPFYRSPTLSYGNHSILITIDNVDETTKRRYYFDFFIVEGVQDDDNAQGTGSTNGPGFTIVDDRDSRVSYSGGGWTTVGSGTSTDYGRTTSTTPSGRDGVIDFRFTGTDVAVYGRIHDNYGPENIAQFTIDGGTADQIVKTVAFNGMTADRRHQPLLVLDRLKEGEHTIQVKSLGEQTPPWYFDYFVYGTSKTGGSGGNGSGSVNTPQVGEGSASVVATTFTSGGVVVTATQTMSDLDIDLSSNNGSSDSNSNASIASSSTTVTTKSNTAVIAGSTIGAVALLSLLIFLILYWIRKRKLQRGYLSHLDLEEDEKELRSGGMGGGGGGGVNGGSGIVGQAASMRARGAGAGENMELDDVSSNTQDQQARRLSRLHPPFAFAEKGRPPLPHAGTTSARSSNEHGVAPRNNAQTTVVNSVIMSDDSSAFEESEFASSIVPLSPSSAPPNTEFLHPAVAQAAEGNVVLATNVVVVPGDGSRGSIKAAYKSNGTGDWLLSPTSSASNQTQLQPRPPYVTRQGQGTTGGEDILRIGREVDSGIRLDPMQFNLTAPDLLPPSYSATTYRP